ncbi:MAG: aspartate carbamoyltransferase [Acidimicrobiales bacterium]
MTHLRRPRTIRLHRQVPTLALAAAALVGVGACGGDGSGGDGATSDDRRDRQAEVAERGADVMPFDLDATTHRFEPTDDGLVQTVVADDPGDSEQVALVRQHLADEAERFRQGDYADPAAIHGNDMPGLGELEAGADAIRVDLADAAAGARLTFTAEDVALVDALHRWADAQTMDHGAHAEAP